MGPEQSFTLSKLTCPISLLFQNLQPVTPTLSSLVNKQVLINDVNFLVNWDNKGS